MTRRVKVWMLPLVCVGALTLASATNARAQGWSFQIGTGYYGGHPGGYYAYRPPVYPPQVFLPPAPCHPRHAFGPPAFGYGAGYPRGASFTYGYRPSYGGGYGGHGGYGYGYGGHGHGHCR